MLSCVKSGPNTSVLGRRSQLDSRRHSRRVLLVACCLLENLWKLFVEGQNHRPRHETVENEWIGGHGSVQCEVYSVKVYRNRQDTCDHQPWSWPHLGTYCVPPRDNQSGRRPLHPCSAGVSATLASCLPPYCRRHLSCRQVCTRPPTMDREVGTRCAGGWTHIIRIRKLGKMSKFRVMFRSMP